MFGNASNLEFFLMLSVLGVGIVILMSLSETSIGGGGFIHAFTTLPGAIVAVAGLAGCVYYTLMPDKIYFYDDPRVDQVLVAFWVAAALVWVGSFAELFLLRTKTRPPEAS